MKKEKLKVSTCIRCNTVPRIYRTYDNCYYVAYVKCPICGRASAASYSPDENDALKSAVDEWNEDNK